MKYVSVCIPAICGLLLVTMQLRGQSQAMNGVIEGMVRAEDGPGLPGASVNLRNMDNGAVRRLRTNNTGRYRAPLLPLGRYEISAERAGFRPGVRSSILLQIGQTLTVNFTLPRAATPAVTEVSAPAALLEPDRKHPGTTIDLRFLDNLPLFGRKFMDLGVMVPGATEFGQRDTSATGDFGGVNHFYSNSMVDGTYSYQAWSGLPNGKFLVPFEYSQNAIREFQILNGNFTAEFGRSAGGLINVVTKSGTNQMHGDASYLFSDSSMNATPRFALRNPKTRQQEFAGSLGGPLVADKLFLFGNYDQQPRREPMIVIPGTVLDGFDGTLASITNPDEQQRFIHAGEFVRSLLGSFERNLNQYTFLTRADWHPTSKHSVSARFNYQKFHATNFPENGFAEPIVSGLAVSNNGKVGVENNSLAMQWSVAISPQTLNEARLQFALGNESQVANSDGPQVLIGSATAGITFGRRDVFPSYLREQRWQFVDNVTFIRGRHEIKAGADVDRVSDRNSFLPASSGSYQFNNLRNFANGRYLTYTQGFGVPEVTTVSPYYGVFVQDNIKLASNLSMNAGLRYEFQHLQAASVSNPQLPRTAQVPEDKNNFAPRLAFAWQPREKLVIRTSYGIYYGVIPVQTEAVARTQNGALQSVRVFQGSGAPGAPQYPQVLSAVPGPQTPLPGAKIAVFSPDFVNPYIQQVNLEVEREIGADFSVSSGWLYTKGTKLRSNEDLNLFPPGTRTIQVNDTARNFSGLFTVPYFGGPASRPFPFFDQIDEFRSDNNSVYHAFFVQLNKRYSRGLQFLFNYTVSKLIDRGQAPGNQFTCCTSDNPFDPGGERGLGLRDQRNRFNFASVWDLPGVATQNALARNVLRGWRLNSILHAGSGRPLTPTVTGDAGGDVNGDGIRGDRAPFFGRNTIIFPGNAAVDLALHRVFSKEGKTFDIGLEAFNVFNRANYLRPPTDYYIMTNVPGGITRLDGPIPSFDKPTTALPSRQLQGILRFSF